MDHLMSWKGAGGIDQVNCSSLQLLFLLLNRLSINQKELKTAFCGQKKLTVGQQTITGGNQSKTATTLMVKVTF